MSEISDLSTNVLHEIDSKSDKRSWYNEGDPDIEPAATDIIDIVPSAQSVQQALKDRFLKTRLCIPFLNQQCRRGDRCTFAHDYTELRNPENLAKTTLCRQWLKSGCDYSNCSFAHGEAELRTTSNLFKTGLCRFWKKGVNCVAGAACRHAHGPEELRPITSPLQSANSKSMMCLIRAASEQNVLQRRKSFQDLTRAAQTLGDADSDESTECSKSPSSLSVMSEISIDNESMKERFTKEPLIKIVTQFSMDFDPSRAVMVNINNSRTLANVSVFAEIEELICESST